MSLAPDIQTKLREAVRPFWLVRRAQSEKQGSGASGRDAGERAAVTGGAQMDGFSYILACEGHRCGPSWRARGERICRGGMARRSCVLIFLVAAGIGFADAAPKPAVRLIQTVPLPDVHGRIDHFALDFRGRRLFMSALGNNTVEVFDLRSHRRAHTIRGLREPQGVSYATRSGRLFVANGGDGSVRMYDGATYRLLRAVRLSSDADDARYDAATNRVFVGYGDRGSAGIAILDGASGKLLGAIPLPAHPEGFQLEENGPKIFVNIPSAGNIVDVLNRDTGKVLATWRLAGARENFPMALDDPADRLFIVCRAPAELLILDGGSGKIVARIPSAKRADDVWYDAANRRVYVSGGGGFLEVVAQEGADRYRELARVPTAPGARTSLLAPRLQRLYVGVWGRSGRPEELRIYEVGR